MKRKRRIIQFLFVFIGLFFISYLLIIKAPEAEMGPTLAGEKRYLGSPKIDPSSYIHPTTSILGDIQINERIFIGPFVSIRSDENTSLEIGKESNIQDGVVIHGAQVSIGERVSLAHQSQIHGPAQIGNNVFVGMQAFVYRAQVKDHVIIEPGAKIIGVTIPEGVYVPAGEVVTEQKKADHLPKITKNYVYSGLNEEVVKTNLQLTEEYQKQKTLKKNAIKRKN